ncbi:hypothetical protein BDD12DRAFT_902530 [Trichophaea hybrida]|nr:hypothetical protein BDD12DRAFT_902530 [Trichophaea hybrida]
MPISRNKPSPPPTNLPLLTPPPPPLSSLTFTTPTRRLVTPHDLTLFQASPTYTLLFSFVTDLSNSVLNLPNSSPIPTPPIITQFLDILSHVESTVSEFPPEDAGGSRFGNKSFQRFYDAIWERAGGGMPE